MPFLFPLFFRASRPFANPARRVSSQGPLKKKIPRYLHVGEGGHGFPPGAFSFFFSLFYEFPPAAGTEAGLAFVDAHRYSQTTDLSQRSIQAVYYLFYRSMAPILQSFYSFVFLSLDLVSPPWAPDRLSND